MRSEIQNLQIPLPIAIIGLGLSGESALRLLQAAGIDRSQIRTFDQKNPADYQDPDKLMSQGKPRSLCVSPGVPLKTPWIQAALAQGLRLTSELEMAFAFVTTEKTIAITGAVGKSTTTSILGAGARIADPNVFVGGNLGLPLADYATDLMSGNRNKASYLILELSSYQLENFRNLKCTAAVLTHLSPNHLERYESTEQYYETKLELFKHAEGLGVLNQSGGDLLSWLDRIKATHPTLPWRLTDRNDGNFQQKLKQKPNLVGSHNLDNLSLAFAVAEFFQWPQESFNAMIRFPGLSHRLENCGTLQGVLFLNDSKATTVDSVLQALQSVIGENPQRPLHLLIGGKDKNLPWENLQAAQKYPYIQFYFFGEVGGLAQTKSRLPGPVFQKLTDCLFFLKGHVKPGDIVLLSPGGTSWDEFKNFEERGQFFKNWVLSEFQSHKG
jgi:UDP-N-acetylmuramoylalanine--D-glutamate ligase